jgi:hypothetical protein
MTNSETLMRRVRIAAEILRAKAALQRQMPVVQRLQTVGRINQLRTQLNRGRPVIPSLPIKELHK